MTCGKREASCCAGAKSTSPRVAARQRVTQKRQNPQSPSKRTRGRSGILLAVRRSSSGVIKFHVSAPSGAHPHLPPFAGLASSAANPVKHSKDSECLLFLPISRNFCAPRRISRTKSHEDQSRHMPIGLPNSRKRLLARPGEAKRTIKTLGRCPGCQSAIARERSNEARCLQRRSWVWTAKTDY